MKFKTYEGAAKRAAFERGYAKQFNPKYTYRVMKNPNEFQVRDGYVWIVKKEKIKG